MGVLDLVGERDQYAPVDAVQRLAAAIGSWRDALDIVQTRVQARNSLTIDAELATVTFNVVMPLVARAFHGDEHVFSDAMALLRRYVRTHRWYDSAPELADEDSSEEFLNGAPIPPRVQHMPPPPPPPPAAPIANRPRRHPVQRNPFGSPERRQAKPVDPTQRNPFFSSPERRQAKPVGSVSVNLRTDETMLDDAVDSVNGGTMAMASMSLTGAAMRTTTNLASVPTVLVESAIVCVRLAASNVAHHTLVDEGFYERISDVMENPTRAVEQFKAMATGIELVTLHLREAAVLTSLQWRAATTSVFDMWTFFDASTVPVLTANAETATTLRAMATVLLSFVQLDKYAAVQRPWLTAAAVATLLADSVLERDVVERVTVDAYAALLTQSDLRGEWTLSTAHDAIVARANYVRESFVDFSSRGNFGSFRKLMVRKRGEEMSVVYQEITDLDVISVANHIEASMPLRTVVYNADVGNKRGRTPAIVPASPKRSWWWTGAALLPPPPVSQS